MWIEGVHPWIISYLGDGDGNHDEDDDGYDDDW